VTLVPEDGRARVGLAMPVLRRVVDVSVQPAAPCGALREAGRRASTPSGWIEGAAREALGEAARRSDAWSAQDAPLIAAFGGIAFPLLAAIYQEGGTPVQEVPRWAEPVLAARTAREGAVAAFGPKATRPVVRGLVRALVPHDGNPVDLTALALAMIGAEALSPDRLARVLSEDQRGSAMEQLLDPSSLAEARRRMCMWGPVRTERVLRDAACASDGLRMLLDTVRYARYLGSQGPARLPNRLSDLHDAHRVLIATAPPSPPCGPGPATAHGRPPRPRRAAAAPTTARTGREAQMRRAVQAADRADAAARRPHQIFVPPADVPAVSPHVELAVPDAVRRFDGTTSGDLTFVVPRTAGDLQRWSRMLSNCLDGYAPAMAAGRTVILGVQRDGVLRYALEIAPGAVVRQFVGPANRPPEDHIRRTVLAALAAAGLLQVG